MVRRLFLLVWISLFSCLAKTQTTLGASTKTIAAAGRVPLYFEKNQGQTAADVRYVARAGGYTAWVTDHETVLRYHNGKPGENNSRDAVVRIRLNGSAAAAAIQGGEPLPGVVNYLVGKDRSTWHTRIPTYARLTSDQVYPGIDMVYRANGRALAFDFHVAAAANPDLIRIGYAGAANLHLTTGGDLVFDTAAGPASILKPVAYQDVDGKRALVSANYQLLADGQVGFQLGQYDRSRPLVIDPTIGPSIYYSTYLGSGSGDTFTSIAVDPAGEAFIVGQTYATNYPTGAQSGYSPYMTSVSSNYATNSIPAGFVTALNASGTGILYSTYISGSSASASVGVALNSVAVNSTGFAFVGGQTDDPTFPILKSFQSTIPSSRTMYGDAVGLVFELSQHGDSLIYSSFLGGGDYDSIAAIAIDGSNNAYVTGTNTVQGSTNTTSGFPITSGVIWGHPTQQNIGAGFNDAFAAKIVPPSSGNATLAYSTVIGSTGSITPFTYGSAIAVDASGDAYVAGFTNCNIADHGGTVTTNLNMTHVTRASTEYVNNAWVLELNPTATVANYIAYLGGSTPGGMYSPDTSVAGIKVDSSGNAYVAGTTEASDFQTTSGAYQTTRQLAGTSNAGTEQSDGYVTVIASGGTSFSYSTYLNGTTVSAAAVTDSYYGSPTISGIALGMGGQFAVAGVATTTNFPQSGSPAGNPLLTVFPGCPSACLDYVPFITKFQTSGLVYSTFLGAGDESVNGIAANGTDVYVLLAELGAGLNSGGAYDTNNPDGNKELVLRVADPPAVATTLAVDAQTANHSSAAQTVSLTSSLTAASTVNGGIVGYTVTDSTSTQIGSQVVSGIVAVDLPPSTSFTLPANTPTGTYTIHAQYVGAQSFLSSSATGSLVVPSPAPASTTTVTSSLNPSTYGQSVTFSATVSSATTGPAGTVQFVVDGVNFGSAAALSTASASSKTASSQATTILSATGSPHTVVANYLNTDGNFANSSGTLAGGQTVTAATQATLTVTGMPTTPQAYGTTFTVGSSGGSGSGAVTFSASGSCSVSGSTATITSGSGTCSVTATKASDTGYASTTSAAATVSAAPATQSTLTATGVPTTAQAYGATFTVSSSGGSGTGTVTFSTTGSCSVSGAIVTITSGAGTCSVIATKAADSHYALAISAPATVSAAQATQASLAVTGVPGSAQAYGATFTVSTSGGSGTGAVTFTATGSCSVAGTTVTITNGSGTCSVTASKAADSNYASAIASAATVSATTATQTTLVVTGVPTAAQPHGTTFMVGTSGGNGTGAVTFAASGSCTVAGATVTITSGSGTCSVTAAKAADSNYASATSAAATVSAAPATQTTLTVTGMPTVAQAYGTTLTVGTSGGSGTGAVTFSASGSCTVVSTTVTITSGAGTCSVTAVKAADANYAAATSIATTVSASKATPIVSVWPTASSITYGQTLASSILSGGAASVPGTFTFTAPGTTPPGGSVTQGVTFTPTDSADYATVTGAALVTVNPASATVTLGNLVQTYTGSPLGATATTAPGNLPLTLTYTFNAQPAPAPTNAGSYGVTATISSVDYNGTASGTLLINQAPQALTFAPPVSPVIEGVAPIMLTATGGASGNPVVFSVVSGPGSVSGNTLTLTGVGTVVVAANQAGNNNYTAAVPVTQSIVVQSVSLTFNSTGLAFNSVPVGSSSPGQTLILINNNPEPVTVTSIQASGDFSAVNACSTIAAFSNCSVNVIFTPTQTGERTATVTVTEANASGPQTVPLTGTGTAPGLQVTPAEINFGSQNVSTPSLGEAITLQNTGTALLTTANFATSGDFSSAGDCANVPAGSSCSLTITFTPTAAGPRTGAVTFTGDNGGQVVNLLGIGTQAGATLTPSTQIFPGTLIGAQSYVLNATLTNSGTTPLTGIGVSILGDFTQTNTCAATLAPGASCLIAVTYAPTIAGSESGSLMVADSLGVQSTALVGTGLAPASSIDTAQLLYGGQRVGTSSLAQTVLFRNLGTTPASITAVEATPNFTDTTNCAGSIAPGGSCSVNVIFTPTTTGPLSGTVTVTTSAGTQIVNLRGEGENSGLSVAPSFAIFGGQSLATASQAQTLLLSNTGTSPLTLNPITVSNNFSQSNQCPAILAAAASCAISVSFLPTAVGPLAGALVVSDSSSQASTLATVSGQGTLAGVTISPATVSFGSLAVGTASQAQTVTVANTGSSPLQIGSVSGNGDFAQTNTCSSQTIAPAGQCVISVTMTPTTVGTRTGTIRFNDNAQGEHQIAVSGAGQAAGVTLFPTSLAFGSLPLVTPAQASTAEGTALSLTITNSGGAALQLNGFSTQGDFTQSNSCGTSLAVGASCTVTIQFVPTGPGHRTGTLTIADSAGTQLISLAGDGAPQGLTLSPPVLYFGEQTIGQTSVAKTATLTNRTGRTVTGLVIAPSGEFSESDSCGAALADGASCALNIAVTAETAGAITGTITIASSAAASPGLQPARTESLRGRAAAGPSAGVGVVAVSAFTSTTANPTQQLAFGVAPAPEVPAGANAGSSLTVAEDDAEGNPVNATDTVTITVNGPGGYTAAHTAAASNGIATFNLASYALTVPGEYTYTATVAQNASIKPATAAETVSGGAAAKVTALAGSGQSGPVLLPFSVPLQVMVTDSLNNPVSGVIVIFTGPATGAGASLSSASAVTDQTGKASVTATANSTVGSFTITATVAGATTASFLLTNLGNQVASAISLASDNPRSLLRNAVAFTATVSVPAGVATGTVNIMEGTTLLGSGTLSAGIATVSISSLTVGSHAISAIYSGDTNDLGATSTTLTQLVIDFALTAGAGPVQAVLPGGSATYSVSVVPTAGTTFPVPAILSVTGMPNGATATLSPSLWTPLSATSWQLPADMALTDVSLTVFVPQRAVTALASHGSRGEPPPLLWGILLLPFACKLRRGRACLGQTVSVLVLLGTAAAMAGLGGCGAGGFFGNPPTTQTVNVTVTAGTLSHSTSLSLRVQ